MASAEREEVIEHARANPEEGAGAIAKRFGLNKRTVQRWLVKAGNARLPSGATGATPSASGATPPATGATAPKPKAKRKARAKGHEGTKRKEEERAPLQQPPKAPRPTRAGGKLARPQVDASTLHPDERARLLRIINGCREITEASVNAFLARLEAWRMRQPAYLEIEDAAEQAAAMNADPIPAMDARQAQVNLNHQRMIESMLGTYTGLMELANTGSADEPEEQAARSDRVAAALGLSKP